MLSIPQKCTVCKNMFIQINNIDYSTLVLGTVCAFTVWFMKNIKTFQGNPKICDADWKEKFSFEEWMMYMYSSSGPLCSNPSSVCSERYKLKLTSVRDFSVEMNCLEVLANKRGDSLQGQFSLCSVCHMSHSLLTPICWLISYSTAQKQRPNAIISG